MRVSVIVILMLICGSISVWSQLQRPRNQPYADMKWYHLGFHIGLHVQDLIVMHSGVSSVGEMPVRPPVSTPEDAIRDKNTPPAATEIWYGEIPSYSPGFSVGVLGDMYLNPYFNLRLTPTVHFGDKRFMFIDELSKERFETTVRSNYFTLPLDIKYSSVRLNNARPYLLGGVYGAIDIGRKRGNPLLLKPYDYGIEFGFGCDVYLPYFKLCPELKFCFGLTDVLERSRTDLTSPSDLRYTRSISSAYSRLIVFTFNFE